MEADGGSDTTGRYLEYSRRKFLFLLGAAAALAALAVVSVRLGSTDLSYAEIIKIIFTGNGSGPDGWWNSYVVWNLRLPIIAAAILTGAALGVAGAVMQGILRNPLASPFTLGLSNASAFGASLGILIGTGGLTTGWFAASGIGSPALTVMLAMAFAMIATGVVILLVKATSSTPETVVLAGLAISAVFSSGLAFLQYIANDVALQSMVFWQFGSLDKLTWDNLLIIFAVTMGAAVYFLYKRLDYNVMEAGDEVAAGLGLNISSTRIIGLAVSALLTAVVVSFAGIIGFIGLLAPHVVRRLIGSDNRYLLAGSMIVGAVVMLAGNIISQHAFGVVVPIGIITSAIGGPLFLYILIRGHRRAAC
ncbi:MAG: iron ABC transporter permease [Candidatus Methanoplasma sp.]|jgi:iron complex transport system permease protein|nr:iron ABC transporter permease [Candidatus Methanoplasma sp.]